MCGVEQETVLTRGANCVGSGRFCSMECLREGSWRETLSIMGKEYYPRDPSKDTGNRL
jgi:hypothetical protein